MKKQISILITCLFLLFIMSSGCSESSPPTDESAESESFPKEFSFSSAGVVVYGKNPDGWLKIPEGWVKNTNDFSVRIQQVGNGTDYNDRTNWIFVFGAGQVKKITLEWGRTCFHIYDMEGKPIGFIFAEKQKPEKK